MESHKIPWFHIIQHLLLVDKFIISPIDGWFFPFFHLWTIPGFTIDFDPSQVPSVAAPANWRPARHRLRLTQNESQIRPARSTQTCMDPPISCRETMTYKQTKVVEPSHNSWVDLGMGQNPVQLTSRKRGSDGHHVAMWMRTQFRGLLLLTCFCCVVAKWQSGSKDTWLSCQFNKGNL